MWEMNREAKLSCKKLWKLYGSEPDRFFARHNNQPEQEDITDGGYICAVREVTFDVYPGEIVVVMGLSGSGKSTLVRCLSRLIEPTGGEIIEVNDIVASVIPTRRFGQDISVFRIGRQAESIRVSR